MLKTTAADKVTLFDTSLSFLSPHTAQTSFDDTGEEELKLSLVAGVRYSLEE